MPLSSSGENPGAVATSYLVSFSTGDVGRIAGHVTEDFVNEHTAALGAGCVGRDAYMQRLPGFLADMANLRYDVEHLVVDGDQVAAFYTMSADWQGTVPISIRGVQRFTISEGRISHRTDYWDSASFLLQASEEATAALAPFGVHP